jgi:hypothetical protein
LEVPWPTNITQTLVPASPRSSATPPAPNDPR